MTNKTISSLRQDVRYERPDASVFSFRAEGLLCVSTGIANLTVNDLHENVSFDE
ncbi:MAG: hypothetical protein IJV01_05385 [Bacteroidales bacterium]|nr:hypothetical protein [Bacteroidales bacterium]